MSLNVTVWPGLASAGSNFASTFLTAFSYHFWRPADRADAASRAARQRPATRQIDAGKHARTHRPPPFGHWSPLIASLDLCDRPVSSAPASLLRHRRRFDALQLQRRHRLRLHVDDADAVGVGVGDVQLAAGVAQAARLVEQRRRQPAVRLAAQERRAASLVFGSITLILLL